MKQNEKFSDRLKKYMADRDMTYDTLSKITGVPAQTLNRYVLGQRIPKVDAAAEIAIKLNVDPLWLQGIDSPLPSNFIPVNNLYRIPIIGSVRCGYGGAAFEEIIGHDYADVKNPNEYIFFTVKGDSMEPEIREGNLALVHRQPNIENGELAIVVINGDEGTLKKVIIKDDGSLILQAFNSKYEPLSFSGKELEQIHICGKVVETKKKW